MNFLLTNKRNIKISFITSLKICKGYSDFGHRIRLYIENITYYCNKNNISYEILIGLDIDEKNELYYYLIFYQIYF